MRDSFRALPCVYTRGTSRKRHYYTKIRVQSQAFPKSWVLCFKAPPTAFSLPIRDHDRLSYPKNGCSLYASRIFCIAAFGCRDLNSAEPDTRIFAPASVQ